MMLWILVLYVAGMTLILAEFIVPGLICGIVGSLLLVGSGVLAYNNYPDSLLIILLAEFVGAFISVAMGMFVLARTRAGKNLVLTTSQQAHAGWVASDTDVSLAGAEGEVLTALRPAGTVLIHGKRVDAVSEGVFIDAGIKVRVIAAHGSRVVVEQISTAIPNTADSP